MTEIKLRDYQREAIDAVFTAWSDGMKAPAIVLPTGAGKTVVFSALVREWRHDTQYTKTTQGQRVMILAHRDELVDQAIAKLRAVMPGVNVGKVKATDRQTAADVMVCSVQTLATRSGKALQEVLNWESDVGRIGLVITDECHHAAAASYRKIYDAFPDALRLGVTATMSRQDGKGLAEVWDDVVYTRSILNLISKGHLVDVRTQQVKLESLDLGGVPTSGRDWRPGPLGDALMEAHADTAIARAVKAHTGRERGIVFTPTVATAWAACAELDRAGIPAEVVTGETLREERQVIYERFRQGSVRVLVNCMVLTEGFDAPWAQWAMIARPTQSEALYAQMVGRVLRPYPGKKEALVLDLVGNSDHHRLRTLADLEPDAVKRIRDGESLAEAVIREEEEANGTVRAGSPAFELKVRDVASFQASDHAWIRTPAGVLFIPCDDDKRVFLWPANGLWDVCLYVPGETWARTAHTGLDIGSAMAWGEAVAEDHHSGRYGLTKASSWRHRKPSDKLVWKAVRLGIDPTGLKAGDLSDRVNRALGARLFDRHVGKA